MNTIHSLLLVSLLVWVTSCSQRDTNTADQSTVRTHQPYAMVIHGGAGTIERSSMTAEKETAYQSKLTEALETGKDILNNGGSSEDAVIAVISLMENSPLFNAGKGAVFTHDGQNSLDASIMDGSNLNAGAVAGIRTVKNPITAARAVMHQSEHVLLSGNGADEFASLHGLEVVDSSYFFTQRRWDHLQTILDREKETGSIESGRIIDEKFGTVGAVALDKSGNICAGTSTGGMTNKRYDRVGDSPIIGAGTYADNRTCGVSCTGHGEFFIRFNVAADVTNRMKYLGEPVDVAASTVISDLKEVGGSGGLIALDHNGNVSMPFNTSGMYRGYINPDTTVVAIYK